VPGEQGTDPVGQARLDVRVVDHDGYLAAPGRQVRGGGHVSAEADHDPRPGPVQDLPGGAHRVGQPLGDAQQVRGRLARQRDRRDEREVVPAQRDQAGLQAALGAEAGERDPGIRAAQSVGDREGGLDMASTAPSGEYHAHRQVLLFTMARPRGAPGVVPPALPGFQGSPPGPALGGSRGGLPPLGRPCAGPGEGGLGPPSSLGRLGLAKGGRCGPSRRRSRPSQLRARRAGPGPASASAWAAPGSRLANAISIPSAIIVVTRDERPAETSGSGTPVIGISPITAPMFTIAWPTIQMVAPAAARRMKVSSARRATRRPAKARPPYSSATHSVPTSPSSSPMIAKMKSVVSSGTHPHFWVLAPSPTPNHLPEPTAHLP